MSEFRSRPRVSSLNAVDGRSVSKPRLVSAEGPQACTSGADDPVNVPARRLATVSFDVFRFPSDEARGASRARAAQRLFVTGARLRHHPPLRNQSWRRVGRSPHCRRPGLAGQRTFPGRCVRTKPRQGLRSHIRPTASKQQIRSRPHRDVATRHCSFGRIGRTATSPNGICQAAPQHRQRQASLHYRRYRSTCIFADADHCQGRSTPAN